MKTIQNYLLGVAARSIILKPYQSQTSFLDEQYHVVLDTQDVDLTHFGLSNDAIGLAVAHCSYSSNPKIGIMTHSIVEFKNDGTIELAIPNKLLRKASPIEVRLGKRANGVFSLQHVLGEYHLGKKPYALYLEVKKVLSNILGTNIHLVGSYTNEEVQSGQSFFGNLFKDVDFSNLKEDMESLKRSRSGVEKSTPIDTDGSILLSPHKEIENPLKTGVEALKVRSTAKNITTNITTPILSWDFNEEAEKVDKAILANGTTIPKEDLDAAKAIAQEYVDSLPIHKQDPVSVSVRSTEVMVEGTPAIGAEEKSNPDFIPATKEELLERAMKNIGMLDRDAGLEDLGGERVQVDDKAMINCRADLNQLVPFKYEWAWQAYLKATENHWMPLEVSLEKDIVDWVNCTPDESKLIQLALYSLETYSSFNTNDPLLAIYRFLTNPEARQYILRQRFELTVWGNFVHNVMDNFNYQFPVEKVTNPKTGKVVENCDWYSFNDKNYESFLKREQIKAKLDIRKMFEAHIGDNKFIPQDTNNDNVGIIERIVMYYICHGFIFNFASLIQLVGLKGKGKFLGLSTGADNILRDVALHTGAGVLILRQIFAENPELMSKDICKHLMQFIHKACDAEIEYMDWYANSDLPNAKSSDQIQTLKYMVNRFTEELGIGTAYPETERFAKCADFVVTYDAHLPNLHGGGSSVLGSGGALSFDEDTSETVDEK